MSQRFWPIATVVLGVAALVIVMAFQQLPAVKAAYPAGDFALELGRFQRASTPADLASVFGAIPEPALLRAMTAGNTLDLYGFIPAYTLFLVAAAAMLAGGIRMPIAWLGIVPTLIGTGADIIETSKQLAITADYDNAFALLPIAPWCWTKFFGLAFGAWGMSGICFFGARKRWILGALGFAPLAATFADWSGVVHIPTLMTLGSGVFWIALIVVGAMEAFKRAAPAPDALP